MKKLNYFLLAAAGLMLASCSQEETVPSIAEGDGNYSVTISLPKDMVSRAGAAVSEFGLGNVANQLNYAVYDATSGNFVFDGMASFPNGALETTVNFNLVRGKSYNIAFFAQSQTSINEGVYTFNGAGKTMTVNYEAMKSESNLYDAYDCFYNVLPTGQIGSTSVNASVVLNRPVGQVNWGTNDLVSTDSNGVSKDLAAAHDDAYGSKGQYIETNLTCTPFTTLNLLTGEVSGNTAEVTIESMAAPYNIAFPLDNVESTQNATYVYIAMTYILAPKANSTLYDLSLHIDNNLNPKLETNNQLGLNTVVDINAAPVQANYQTNIYGNLLSDDVTVTVRKNPVWLVPDYDVEWAGNLNTGGNSGTTQP